ncbi:TPA: hypothetical protein DF272_05400 [Candidatus Falkowbacteria bacterium]|nr:hypothetical protein [Candidatus Falkowbacteria bacterium]
MKKRVDYTNGKEVGAVLDKDSGKLGAIENLTRLNEKVVVMLGWYAKFLCFCSYTVVQKMVEFAHDAEKDIPYIQLDLLFAFEEFRSQEPILASYTRSELCDWAGEEKFVNDLTQVLNENYLADTRFRVRVISWINNTGGLLRVSITKWNAESPLDYLSIGNVF